MKFSILLIQWYLQNKRDLPWRNTVNPYHIWLSEIMLQQTRVAQGLPYYFRFTEAFPSVLELANASEEEVLKLWQGLGYYSRARNLHKTAQKIAFELNGDFPNNYHDLLQLNGIGEYTAAAIASFSYNEPVPVVDGNVFRVLSRYFDIESDILSAKTKKEFVALAKELMPNDKANLFNQAIMEFGALFCVPKSPNCHACIFNDSCLAFSRGKVSERPVKSKKVKVVNRYLNYFVFLDNSRNTIIQKRVGKGIWRNLYEFPQFETDNLVEDSDVIIKWLNLNHNEKGINNVLLLNDIPILHKLTHQHLYISYYIVNVSKEITGGVPLADLKSYPFPIAIYNFIEKYSIIGVEKWI